jgi:hypothetical protein
MRARAHMRCVRMRAHTCVRIDVCRCITCTDGCAGAHTVAAHNQRTHSHNMHAHACTVYRTRTHTSGPSCGRGDWNGFGPPPSRADSNGRELDADARLPSISLSQLRTTSMPPAHVTAARPNDSKAFVRRALGCALLRIGTVGPNYWHGHCVSQWYSTALFLPSVLRSVLHDQTTGLASLTGH